MNNTDILNLEIARKKKLESYAIDADSILKNKKTIKEVTPNESENKGEELYKLLSKKTYNEETELNQVITLIKEGANLEFKSLKKGDFPLLLCARRNYLKTFIVLIKYGANINQVNNYMTTSTMTSARHGNKEVLEILILMGADINARCLDGDNALMSAKRHDQVECFNILVKAQAYLNSRNLANKTVLDIPSTKEFPITTVSKTLQYLGESKVMHEDALNLIEEAKKRLLEINAHSLK